ACETRFPRARTFASPPKLTGTRLARETPCSPSNRLLSRARRRSPPEAPGRLRCAQQLADRPLLLPAFIPPAGGRAWNASHGRLGSTCLIWRVRRRIARPHLRAGTKAERIPRLLFEQLHGRCLRLELTGNNLARDWLATPKRRSRTVCWSSGWICHR